MLSISYICQNVPPYFTSFLKTIFPTEKSQNFILGPQKVLQFINLLILYFYTYHQDHYDGCSFSFPKYLVKSDWRVQAVVLHLDFEGLMLIWLHWVLLQDEFLFKTKEKEIRDL